MLADFEAKCLAVVMLPSFGFEVSARALVILSFACGLVSVHRYVKVHVEGGRSLPSHSESVARPRKHREGRHSRIETRAAPQRERHD